MNWSERKAAKKLGLVLSNGLLALALNSFQVEIFNNLCCVDSAIKNDKIEYVEMHF